jgi:hypothetical protein
MNFRDAFTDELEKLAKVEKKCPGGKIRSKGMGRGLGFGGGKGPIGIPFGKKTEQKQGPPFKAPLSGK